MYKPAPLYISSPVYKPIKKHVQTNISPGLIFRGLQYVHIHMPLPIFIQLIQESLSFANLKLETLNSKRAKHNGRPSII
jgi:hypothetical protein